MEQEGARKKYIKSRGKVNIWKKNNKQERKIQAMRMSVNEHENIQINGREKKKAKKVITILFRKGSCTRVKSTDSTRCKCTVHIICRRDSVREGPLRIKKSLCVVCRIMYKGNRYSIKCGKTKCDMIVDRYKMSTEPMDIPEGGGGGGGKGDGEKGKKSATSLYVLIYAIMPTKPYVVTLKTQSKPINVKRSTPLKLWNIYKKCTYNVAVRHNRYGE